MLRRFARTLTSLIPAILLAGTALDASGASTPGSLQELKLLQRRQLLLEPAERMEKYEKIERLRAWRKKMGLGTGQRLRPAAKKSDGAAVARGATAGLAARAGIAVPTNHLVNDPTGEIEGTCQSEVSIASFGDNVVAAWNDGIGIYSDTDTQGYAYSTDGGQTWTDGGVPPNTGIGTWFSDPVVTVDQSTGAFYFSAITLQTTSNGIGVVKGTFSGGSFSWGTPVNAVLFDNSIALIDKEWMAADAVSGNVYLTYSHFDVAGGQIVSDEIRFSRSTDGGQTWSSPVVLSAPADDGLVQGSRPAVGPDGELYVVWHAIGQSSPLSPGYNSPYGRDFLRVRKSIDGGTSFAPQVTADSLFSNFGSGAPGFDRGMGITFPGITVDRSSGPHRGRVYLTWNESLNFYDDLPDTPTGSQVEIEPNDVPTSGTLFQPGWVLRGTVSIPNELDYWKWDATQGQTYIFYLDSLDTGLDASFRVFCSNGLTSLAFSQNDFGGQGVLVFTAPTTARYYLRVASYQNDAVGGYHIVTGINQPGSVVDRARDQRDVFVKGSDNGFVWGPTVRVNDSPGYFDDWLPEVAVDGEGRVHAACYDWRDTPSLCGGASNVYVYDSGDGGLTWNAGTIVTESATNWTTTYSTLIPNQGDYIGLFSRGSAVHVAWAGRGPNGDPDVFATVLAVNCTADPISDPSAETAIDSVIVSWTAPDGTPANVYRQQGTGANVNLGPVTADASNRIVYVDRDVTAGATYTYRLEVTGYCDRFAGTIQVTVPGLVVPPLALYGMYPNPTPDRVKVSFSLAGSGPATLGLYDITGREIRKIEVGSMGPGPHVVDLSDGIKVNAGLYFVRLSQGGKSESKRVSIFP